MSKSRKSFKNLRNFKVFWEARRTQRRPQDAPRRLRDLYTEGHRDPQGAKESHRKPQGKIESHREGQKERERATESHIEPRKSFEKERRFPFHVESGLCWGGFFEFQSRISIKSATSGVPDAARCAKTPQEASWSDLDAPKRPLGAFLGGFGEAKMRPKTLQDGARTGQDGAKTFPRRLKMAPRRP